MNDDIAKYVAPGRCLCCGSRKLQWSPAQIVDACQTWTAANGRTPASANWNNATPEHPSRTTVLYVFGSWNNMLRAAGLFGRTNGGHNWSKDEIANLMLDHLVREGAWPTWRDWRCADLERMRPTSQTVVKMFGSWSKAKKYAGWDPDAATRVIESVATGCSECGGDFSGQTIGCKRCAKRKHGRAVRAERARHRRAAATSVPGPVLVETAGVPTPTADGGPGHLPFTREATQTAA